MKPVFLYFLLCALINEYYSVNIAKNLTRPWQQHPTVKHHATFPSTKGKEAPYVHTPYARWRIIVRDEEPIRILPDANQALEQNSIAFHIYLRPLSTNFINVVIDLTWTIHRDSTFTAILLPRKYNHHLPQTPSPGIIPSIVISAEQHPPSTHVHTYPTQPPPTASPVSQVKRSSGSTTCLLTKYPRR
jgi:hypothetical protein